MPATANGVRQGWKRYVDRATKDDKGCLILWTGLSRWIYEGYHNKVLPREIEVCHKCDNPACINVEHMFEGSHADNMRDCYNKGRHAGPDNFVKARAVAHVNSSNRAKNQWSPGGSLYAYRRRGLK